jgi:hypothetical protein
MSEELPICWACENEPGVTEWYGMAPHAHSLVDGKVWMTTKLPREQWPASFRELPDEPGFGIYTCEACKGTGRTAAESKP